MSTKPHLNDDGASLDNAPDFCIVCGCLITPETDFVVVLYMSSEDTNVAMRSRHVECG